MIFKDRRQAGEKLAAKLKEELSDEDFKDAIVLAIPRGGVIVGKEISQSLNLPIDCLVTKKLPSPDNKELAIGAVGEGGVVVWEEELCQRLAVSQDYKKEIVKQKVDELEKKRQDFKFGMPVPELREKTVLVVDDGIATGATIKAAIAVIRNFNPKQVIVAVPVIAPDALEEVKEKADKLIYLEIPEMFFSLDQFYESFDQIEDQKVVEALKK